MVTIPATIDDVTAGWLSDATGLAVDSVRHEQIGVGVGVSSALYRSHLIGDGVPATVITKLPALAEEAVFTSTMLRMYIREVKFFEDLAPSCPVRVPASYFGAVDEETSAFIVVMEDMGNMRMIDQTEGMSVADAERAVDELAAWHAAYWGKAEPHVASGTIVSLSDPVYPAVLPVVFAEGWEKLQNETELDPAIEQVGPGWTEAMPGILQDICAGDTTVLHGDYRGDNIMFDADDSLVLLDFQITGHGSGIYDLAYFITQSLDSDVASQSEQALFDRWLAALESRGIDGLDRDELWLLYRKAAYFCLVYPVVASRGMDLTDARSLALIEAMNSRFVRAVNELNLADFAS